jgi:ubiquinone/menaquinone biosynthesis C-methylase UbiE
MGSDNQRGRNVRPALSILRRRAALNNREMIMNQAVRSAAPVAATTPDLFAVKQRQQAAWASGDYAVVGTTLQIVGEMLCEAVDLRSGQRVLDVAAGNGNATLAAARRFADVVSTDYVGELLERGRERAAADRLTVSFQEADAENLPFPQGSFDVVLSTFGVMFTPNQEKAAQEMLRVCKPGGKIGLANWTPESFIGRLFKTIGKYVPPAPGVKSPALWGSKAHLDALFGADAQVTSQSRTFVFRYRSPAHWLEIFRTYYGPVLKAFAAIDPKAQKSLEADLFALMAEFNIAKDGTLVVPSEYLEAVIAKRG